ERYSGNAALDMFYKAIPRNAGGNNGGSGFADISHPNPRGTSEFHMRWYEKLTTNWVWSDTGTKGWQLRPVSGAWDLYLTNDMYYSGYRPTVLQAVPWDRQTSMAARYPPATMSGTGSPWPIATENEFHMWPN